MKDLADGEIDEKEEDADFPDPGHHLEYKRCRRNGMHTFPFVSHISSESEQDEVSIETDTRSDTCQ